MTMKPHYKEHPRSKYESAFDDWIRRVNVYRQERARADPSYKPTKYEGPYYYRKWGIYPGGYVDWYSKDGKKHVKTPTVVVREGASKRLKYHEYLHAIRAEGHGHPTEIWPGLKDAWGKGLDCRSAFGVLRLRYGPKEHIKAFEAWYDATR
jgi:hypothetical protein